MNTKPVASAIAALVLAWSGPWALADTPQWTGGGDGISWNDPLNWDTGVVPTSASDVSLGFAPVNLQMGGASAAHSLNFLDAGTLGAFGNNSFISLVGSSTTANINPGGSFLTINNRLTTTGATLGLNGLIVSGGGTLFLTNVNNLIEGNITVDGTTLLINPNFTVPHISGTGTGLNNRSDWNTLAQVQKRAINLTNGGELKIIGAGANADGNTENIVIGTNGGAINVAGGFQQITFDDHPTSGVAPDNQIQVASGATNVSLTKNGYGRLTIGDSGAGPDFNLPLTGTVAGVTGGTGLIINKGVVDFTTIENSTAQTTGVASRFSALSSFAATGASAAQSTVTINNGGMLVINSGTSSKLDTNVILNAGGVIGGQGNVHYLGNFDGANGTTFATTTNVPTFTANGGTILARDPFSTQTQRFLRFRDMLTGTGTVDILGETANGTAPRLVFERGDLQAQNAGFTGTWRLLENTTLESNPRNQSTGTLAGGKPFGNGTVELKGFNAGLDLREANAAITNFTAYQSNTLSLTNTIPGGVNRLAVSGSVNNNASFHLGNITFSGDQYLQLTQGQTNLVRTQNLNFAANSSPTIDTWSTSLRVDNAVNAPTVNLTKLAGPASANLVDLHFANAVTLNNLNIRSGSVVLTEAGVLNTTTNKVTINAGPALAQGALILDNNNTFYTGTTASTNADRLPSALGIEMRGGLLQLKSQNGTSVSETTGNVTAPVGFVTVDATRAGTETATLTLGAGSTLGTKTVANFTGTTLGGTAGQIFLGSIGGTALSYMGPQYIVNGNDFAANGTNGIIAPTAGAGFVAETTGAWTNFIPANTVKVTTVAMATAMPANTNVRSLNIQVAGTLNTNGNTLTLEDGGLLVSTHTISGGAAGGITAGTTTSPANLYLTNSGAVNLNARVTDNLAGGAVTVVKSGAGTLALTHQTGVSYNQQGVLTGTPHTSTNTGGWVVNSGVLQVMHPNYLGTASATNNITLAGGQLTLDMLNSTSNSQFNLGHDVIVEANSRIVMDNNAGTANGMKINNQFNLGKLSVNSGSILSYSGFDQYDTRFNGGASFAPGAMLESIASDGNGHIILNGAITGTAPTFIADRAGGGNPNSTTNQGSWTSVTYGGGAADTTPTALTGDTLLEGGILRLDKANGVNALGSGNVTINGGSLYFGPGQNAQTWGAVGATGQTMQFNGFGVVSGFNDVSMSASGQNQMSNTVTINLLGGNLGENNRVNNQTIGTLNMRNGQFSPGLGTFTIGTANIAGGSVALNTGSNLVVTSALNLQSGAPSISIAIGNTPGAISILDVNNVSMTGQSILTGQGGSLTNGVGKMILRGNLTSTIDPLNAGSYTVGIFQQTGSGFRTLSQNSTLDLAGGARSFDINEQQMFSISSKITNGSIVKDGKGWLALEAFVKNDYNDLTVNQGTVFARGINGLGQSATASTNTINVGGTLRLEDLGVVTNENFVIKGAGAEIPGSRDILGNNPVFEEGALVNEKGANTITGAVAISNDAVISSRSIQAGGLTQPGNGWIVPNNNAGYLAINSAAGITGTGSLTLTGNANGRLQFGLNTGATGSLVKTGGGDWAINGASNYVGNTEISAGSLTISDGAALGTAGGATTVNGGASLRLTNNISTAENLNLAGSGTNDASGALVNLDGVNTVTGTVGLKFPTTIQSRSGTLNLTSNFAGGGNPLTISGAGNTNISSNLFALGAALTKNGSGTLGLSNASGSVTALNANGGVTAMSTALAINASPVNLGGGSVRADASTVLVGGLNANAGGGKVITAGGNFSLGAITHGAGGSVDFSGPGTIVTSAAAGVVPYATFGGTAHANVAGGNVVAFAGYAAADDGVAIASGDKETNVGINVNSNAGIAASTLRIGTSSSGIALGSGTMALTTNTLISNNSGNAGITGTGNINSTGDLMVAVSQASGNLDISAPLNIAAGGNLVKSGAGTLTLSNNANVIPGNIYVNEGTLAVIGLGGTTHPGALGALNGLRTINLSGGALSVPFGDYDPSPSGVNNMSVAIGAAGGTLNVGAGNLLLNDVGQFSAVGDITKVGGGRVQIGLVNNVNIGAAAPDNVPPTTPPYPVRGNVNVNEGILEMVGSSGGLGSVKENVITVNSNGTLVTGANAGSVSSKPFANDVVVNSGGQLFSRNADTRFDGQVTLNGNTTLNLIELDLHNQNRSIWMGGRVVQTGITNIVGTNNGSALFLVGSANDIRGTLNLGANATLEARGQGTLGDGSVNPVINLNGANSRFLLRSEQNSDFYANVNVNNTSEIGADRPNSGGIGGNQLLSINNLNINGPANRAFVTMSGGNTYAVRVNGTANISNSPRLNMTGADLVLSQGATVTGDLLKYSGTSIISEGNVAISGSAIINNGGVYLRGTNGAITGTSSIALRGTGAVLTLDNGDGTPNTNRLPDGVNLILGGGALRVAGQENVLAASVTAAAGQTAIGFTPGSVSAYSAGTVDPLTLTGFTRTKGASLNFTNDVFGTPGNLSSGLIINNANNVNTVLGGAVQVSPRIIIPGQTSVTQPSAQDANQLVNSIIPWAVGQNNEFVQYDSTTIDAGAPRGIYYLLNQNYTNDAVTANVVNRWLTAKTVTSVSVPAIKLDGGVNHTLAAGNTLTVTQGAIISVTTTTQILGGGSITTGATGANELFLTVNGNLAIEPAITEGPTGTAVIKNGAATLNLNVLGNNTSTAPASTFTGGFFQNAGVTESRAPNKIPAANLITMAGGTLSFNPEFSNTGAAVTVPAANTTVSFGNDVRFVGNSLFRVDNGLNAGTGIAAGTGNYQMLFGKLTVEPGIHAQFSGFDSADMQFLNGAQIGQTGGQAPIIDVADAGGGGSHTTRITGNLNAPAGFTFTSAAVGNGAIFELGSGTGDTVANTIGGPITVMAGTLQSNKAAGTAAITSDIIVNGGTVTQLQDNQISDTVNVELNQGTFSFGGKSETIASFTQNGGIMSTGASGTQTITGNYIQHGIGNGTDGLQVNSGATFNIGGNLVVDGLGKVIVGSGAGTRLNVTGDVTLTGTALQINTGGTGTVGITGSFNTLASAIPSYLGVGAGTAGVGTNGTGIGTSGLGDGTIKFDLLNTKAFNIADGVAGDDLIVNGVLQNGATTGGINKNGLGTMVLSGSAANTYTGPTNVNAGTLVLSKTLSGGGVNAMGAGSTLTVGAATVVYRTSNQIPDTNAVVLNAGATFDLEAANASDTVGSISGASSARILVGSGSLLTTGDATNTTFAGSIHGAGALTKQGAGKFTLTGNSDFTGATNINGGTLEVGFGGTGSIHGSPVFVNNGGILSGTGTVSIERTGALQADAAVLLATGGSINPGNSPGILSTGSLFTTGGTVNYEIGGLTAGNGTGKYDQLNVTGTVNLTGTTLATFTLVNGWVNSPSDLYFLLNNDGTDPIVGTFSGIPEGSIVTVGGVPYTATYQADFGSNAISGGNDFALVPEPTAALLTLLSGLGIGLRRRRK